MWICATCRNCVQHCPRGVETIDIMMAMRRILIPDGSVHPGLPIIRSTMTSIATVGNPRRQEPKDRANWAQGLGLKEFSENTELLCFPCCTSAYDPRKMLSERHAVSSFLESEGEILILLRSEHVSSYPGKWAGISGSSEDSDKTSDEQAIVEIKEETGLSI